MFLIIYLEIPKIFLTDFTSNFNMEKINLYQKALWICPIPKSSCMIFLKRLTASQKRITFCMCTSENYEFSFCWNEKKSARAILYIGILLKKSTAIKLFCTRSLEFYVDLHPLFDFSF